MALRVHPDGVGSRLRLDQVQRLRGDRTAALRGVRGAELGHDHAGRIADRRAGDALRAERERPAEPAFGRHRLEVDDAVLAHPGELRAEDGVHRVAAGRPRADCDGDGGERDGESSHLHRTSSRGCRFEHRAARLQAGFEGLTRPLNRDADGPGRG